MVKPWMLGVLPRQVSRSCGLVIYEQLQKMPGVHAVEVFLPVKNQLRLLVEPASNTASEIAGFLTKSRHPATPDP